MRILVIGGSGFLGSHLCDQLTINGHEVTIFDKQNSKWKSNSQKMIVGDISDINLVNRALKKVDYVYNFAGISDLDAAMDLPEETVEQNILNLVKILKCCLNHKIKRFIQASTLYVDSDKGGFYKCSKLASENYLIEFNKRYRLNYNILRFGTLYGPRSNFENGVYSILKKAIKKKEIIYYGNKDSLREYIHVIDAARQSSQILSEKYKNTIFMISGTQQHTIQNFLKLISEILSIKKISIKKPKYEGHYSLTPYKMMNDYSYKINLDKNIELGQGILNLAKEIKNEKK